MLKTTIINASVYETSEVLLVSQVDKNIESLKKDQLRFFLEWTIFLLTGLATFAIIFCLLNGALDLKGFALALTKTYYHVFTVYLLFIIVSAAFAQYRSFRRKEAIFRNASSIAS